MPASAARSSSRRLASTSARRLSRPPRRARLRPSGRSSVGGLEARVVRVALDVPRVVPGAEEPGVLAREGVALEGELGGQDDGRRQVGRGGAGVGEDGPEVAASRWTGWPARWRSPAPGEPGEHGVAARLVLALAVGHRADQRVPVRASAASRGRCSRDADARRPRGDRARTRRGPPRGRPASGPRCRCGSGPPGRTPGSPPSAAPRHGCPARPAPDVVQAQAEEPEPPRPEHLPARQAPAVSMYPCRNHRWPTCPGPADVTATRLASRRCVPVMITRCPSNVPHEPSTKRNPRLIEAGKLENPLVLANNRGTSHPSTVRRQEVFE